MPSNNSTKANSKRIAIVGAGLGGLATAARLAAAGHRVTVCEQDAQPGGKMNRVEADGFRFDTGPSLITMPGVIRETFKACGSNMDSYLQVVPIRPACRYRWPDGSGLDASSDLTAMTREIARLEPRDVAGFLEFIAHGRRLWERAARPFLYHERPSPADLLRRNAADLFRIDAMRTLDQSVRRFFRDPRLVQLFDRYATYNGSSPYLAPGTLALIPYLEFVAGAWYISGGLYRLAESLAALCHELGVDLRLSCPVERVLVDASSKKPQARGLRLANGEEVAADIVVLNSDPLYSNAALFDQPYRVAAGMKRQPRLSDDLSCSGFVMLLGTRREYPQLAHHNIFFSADYPAEFDAIFRRRVPAEDPTIYVTNTGATDRTQAPPGMGNLFVLVNAPALTESADWDSWAEPYAERILDKLESYGLPDLRSQIIYRKLITPADFSRRFNAFGGALYGYSSNDRMAAFRRPANRAPGIDKLFYVGGSAHPGGGVPLALLSARLVSRLAAEA